MNNCRKQKSGNGLPCSLCPHEKKTIWQKRKRNSPFSCSGWWAFLILSAETDKNMSKTGYSAKIKSGHFRHLEQYPLSDRERYCTSRTLKDAPFRESKTEAGNCPGRHRKTASFLTWKKTWRFRVFLNLYYCLCHKKDKRCHFPWYSFITLWHPCNGYFSTVSVSTQWIFCNTVQNY